MESLAFFGFVEVLYYCCFSLLLFLIGRIVVGWKSRSPSDRRRSIAFVYLATSVIAWQATLFLEVRTELPFPQIWIGRFNFAIVALVVYLALNFVQVVASDLVSTSRLKVRWQLTEAACMAALTLFTPLVDAAEIMTAGRAITVFGPLYPVYLAHVLYFLPAAFLTAARARRGATDPSARAQLILVGYGLAASGSIAFVTNAVLPYALDSFGYCDVGGISILVFLLAVAYAVFMHGLFDPRHIVRETLVYGVLLAFVLGGYSSGVFVISQFLTDSESKATQFVVLLIAFSFDPLRRYLEEKTDAFLFRGHGIHGNKGTNKGRKKGRRAGNGQTLALLFPWRHQ